MSFDRTKIETNLGIYPSTWQLVNLADQLELIIDNRGKTPKKSDKGIPSLSAKSVKMGRIDYDKAYFVSEQTYKKFMVRGIPQIGDVLLTTEAPLGCVARLDRDNVCLAQRIITLRGKKGVLDNDYLRLYLSSKVGQHELTARASGSTVQGIKRSEFSKIEIVLPPFEEQKNIARIINDLDKKIDINLGINSDLEELLETIFKSWFINFDPTRAKSAAKASGRNIENAAIEVIYGKSLKHFDSTDIEKQVNVKVISALFSEKLVESECGEIPDDWEEKALGEYIDVKHGYPFQSNFFSEVATNDILLTPGNFKIGGGLKYEKLKYYSGPMPEDYILKPNDLLVTMTDLSKQSDTLGLPALVYEIGDYNFLHNQRLGKVVATNGELRQYFLYFLFKSYRYRCQIVGGATGTTVKHTAPRRILEFVHPFNAELIAIFDSIACSLFSKIGKNINNNETLTQIRSLILPKLLSGELNLSTDA